MAPCSFDIAHAQYEERILSLRGRDEEMREMVRNDFGGTREEFRAWKAAGKVYPSIADVRVTEEQGGILVTPVWAHVDRPDCGGWLLGSKELADRLVRAIKAGVIYRNVTLKIDTAGNSYASANCLVLGRTMNADLLMLGF